MSAPAPERTAPPRVAVALDLSALSSGPSGASGVVAAAETVAALLRAVPGVDLVLVGPEAVADAADRAAAETGAAGRLTHLRAGAPADPRDPDRAVRARLDVPARVGAARVAAGAVDVLVTTAAPQVAVAAARVALPALPGAARPVLAAVVDAGPAGCVVADVGGHVHPDVDTVTALVSGAAQALAGPGARVRVLLGEGPHPVGARHLLDDAVDGMVADGRSGAVLIDALVAAGAVRVPGRVVLGRAGPVVVAGTSASEVAAAVELAARLARGGVSSACSRELAAVVAARRGAAGYSDVPGGAR